MVKKDEEQHCTCLPFLLCVLNFQVKETILAELQHAKYFSVNVDSTLDMLHIDQWIFILKFVSEEGKGVEKATLAQCLI